MILEIILPAFVLVGGIIRAAIVSKKAADFIEPTTMNKLADITIPDTNLIATIEVLSDGTFIVPAIIRGEERMFRVNPAEERSLVASRQLKDFLDGDGELDSLEGVFLAAQVVEEVESMAKEWENSPVRGVREAT